MIRALLCDSPQNHKEKNEGWMRREQGQETKEAVEYIQKEGNHAAGEEGEAQFLPYPNFSGEKGGGGRGFGLNHIVTERAVAIASIALPSRNTMYQIHDRHMWHAALVVRRSFWAHALQLAMCPHGMNATHAC